MTYFSADILDRHLFRTAKQERHEAYIQQVERPSLPGFFREHGLRGRQFDTGDVFKLAYDKGPTTYSFEGICISIRASNFGRKDMTFSVRNVLASVGVEILVAYFLRRVFTVVFTDHRKKRLRYRKQRLFYLRERLNQQSRV